MFAIHTLYLGDYCHIIFYAYLQHWSILLTNAAISASYTALLGLIDFHVSYLGLIDYF